MKAPKPIFTQNNKIRLHCIGYKDKKCLPYISVDFVEPNWLAHSSYLKDKDIKRLRDWCNDYLERKYGKKIE